MLHSSDANQSAFLLQVLLEQFLPQTHLDLTRSRIQPLLTTTTNVALPNLEAPLPVLNHHIFDWKQYFFSDAAFDTLYLRTGTGGRLNQCHLALTLWDGDQCCASAQLTGAEAQDNGFSLLRLDRPLLPGQYRCELRSPDSDNLHHALFVFLHLGVTPRGLRHYAYKPLSVAKPAALSCAIVLLVQPYLLPSLRAICAAKQTQQPLYLWGDKLAWLETYLQQQNITYQWFDGSFSDLLAALSNDYTLFVNPDTQITNDALLVLAEYIQMHPVDVLYADDDRCQATNLLDAPDFKPDFAPELLKTQAYFGGMTLYRTAFLQAQQIDLTVSPHTLWALALQTCTKTTHIHHLTRVLSHRYLIEFDLKAAQTIAQTALDHEGLGGMVTFEQRFGQLSYPLRSKPLVSIIIPTRDLAADLERCLLSLHHTTLYPHWEVVIVDNGSVETATFAVFESYQQRWGARLRIVRDADAFNFSRLVNLGVAAAQGDVVLLLNNDIEVREPLTWLDEMLGFALHPEIACVSAHLLYPQDLTIQHAGLICGIGGIANPGHKHFPHDAEGYQQRLATVMNYSAVTGACLMVEKRLWTEMNGFDENLTVAFNDIDFCLRLIQAGYRHVVLPQVKLLHYESKSRGLEISAFKQQRLQQETAYMQARWGTRLEHDPYYNPHLSHQTEDFRLSDTSPYYSLLA